MKRCEYCKSEIKDNEGACSKCGAPVVQLSKEEAVLKRRRERAKEREEKLKKDKALFKKIGIGFVLFLIIGGILSMFSNDSVEMKVYESAKDEIEYQWDVKTMFDQEDAKISKEGSNYIVYGVVYERTEDDSFRKKGKRLKVKCSVPYKDDVAKRAICKYDE